MIDLKDLVYITTIAHVGGIKKAAESIGISQPALSTRIKNLEDKLDLKLFNRHAKGVRLTQAGELFLLEGQKLLAHSQDFENTLSNHKQGKGGLISIGIKPGLEDAFFRRSLVEFTETYPETPIRVSIDTTPVLSEKLELGVIDIALGAEGYADEQGNELVLSSALEFSSMFEFPLEIIVRKGHPVLAQKLDINALFQYPLICPTPPYKIRKILNEAYKKVGSKLSVPHVQIDDYKLITDLTERSDMWAVILTSSHIRLSLSDKFVFLGDSALLPPLIVGLLKRKTWTLTPSTINLINIMKKHASDWIM